MKRPASVYVLCVYFIIVGLISALLTAPAVYYLVSQTLIYLGRRKSLAFEGHEGFESVLLQSLPLILISVLFCLYFFALAVSLARQRTWAWFHAAAFALVTGVVSVVMAAFVMYSVDSNTLALAANCLVLLVLLFAGSTRRYFRLELFSLRKILGKVLLLTIAYLLCGFAVSKYAELVSARAAALVLSSNDRPYNIIAGVKETPTKDGEVLA